MAFSKNRRLADIIADTSGNLSVEGLVVPTQSASDNDTSAASTAYVTTAVSGLIDSAPGTLNTLNEIAAALNDDANFNTTVTNAIAAKAALTGSNATAAAFNSGTANVVASFTSTDGTGAIQLADNAGNVELSAVGNDFHVQNAGGTAKMLVKSGGNVGMGPSSPVSRLHISGNSDSGDAECTLTIDDEDTTSGSMVPAIQFRGNGNNLARIRANDQQGLLISGSSGNEDDIVVQEGKVGMGTNSPAIAKGLHINSAGNSELRLTTTQDSGTPTAQIGYSAGSGYFFRLADAANNEDVMIRTYGDTVFNAGNVGIGTSSPATSLHIANAGNSFLTLERTGTTGGTGKFGINMEGGSSQQTTMAYDDGGKLVIGRSSDPATMAGFSNDFILDSSGNVGIGTTSPAEKLHVEGSMMLDAYDVGAEEGLFLRQGFSSSNKYNLGIMTYAHNGSTNDGLTIGAYNGFSVCTGSNSRQERMRINSSGKVLIGTTSGVRGAEDLSIDASSDAIVARTAGAGLIVRKTSFGNGFLCLFENDSSTAVGSITSNGSTTAFNTSSDYRLKENVVEMSGALDRVNQLQPKRFNFISDADTTYDGFLAHEVSSIVPEAITGEKDGVDDEGNQKYQGIDQSKLVPLLTKAIQEQQAIIDDLKTRIETLEG